MRVAQWMMDDRGQDLFVMNNLPYLAPSRRPTDGSDDQVVTYKAQR